jgi:hypothetical protein
MLLLRAVLVLLALLPVLDGLEGPARFVKILEPVEARAKAASLELEIFKHYILGMRDIIASLAFTWLYQQDYFLCSCDLKHVCVSNRNSSCIDHILLEPLLSFCNLS